MDGDQEMTEWWRGACIYEVYLRSFQDSDGDGEGDLPGLLRRLPYLADLGVDAIWITPFSPSPMHDSGYDVSDYRAVDPRYGSLADFDAVIARSHELGLKVIIDQVYSHSSNEHPWFTESRSSHDNPKADWYVWADAKEDGTAPNNWLARFGGIAWEWCPQRRQYYLHNFLVEQPDLNLHNKDLQAEILDTMKFWLDRGIDGLRLDVANFYTHDPELRDNPPAERGGDLPSNPYYLQQRLYDRSRPETLPFLEDMRRLAGDKLLLAEISCDWQVQRMVEYTKPGRLHTAYSFELFAPELDGRHIAAATTQASETDSWPTWALSNHDVARVATRWGVEKEPRRITQLHALLLSLQGTVILFQGEELGLPHAVVPREHRRDPEGIRFWPFDRGRDGARTPFPWTNEEGLGFSEGVTTWLPADPAHAGLSVASQSNDPNSLLAGCRSLLALRKRTPALRLGDFNVLEVEKDWLVFQRTHADVTLICAFNFAGSSQRLKIDGIEAVLAGELDQGQLPAGGFVIAEVKA